MAPTLDVLVLLDILKASDFKSMPDNLMVLSIISCGIHTNEKLHELNNFGCLWKVF